MLEDRKNPRTTIETDETGNRFHIEVYSRKHSLHQIHDVSVSGTGIQVSSEIEPGTPIKLVYDTGSQQISVRGTAVWCTPIDFTGDDPDPYVPRYRTGIQFDPHDHNCAIFFMAVKEYAHLFVQNASQGL